MVLKKKRQTGYVKTTSHKCQGKMESCDHPQHRLRKIHAMESRNPISIFVEDGPHLQTRYGKGKETVMLENNPTSTWHQGVLCFHPSLGKKLIQLWCLPFQNLPETLEQVQEEKKNNQKTNPNDLMIAGNVVQWAPQWIPIPYFSLSEKLKKDLIVVCNSLFSFRKNVLLIQGRKLEQGNSKLEIRHILTVRLINHCSEPWTDW